MPSSPPPVRPSGAVIVTRVSSGEQVKHSTSPETQIAACRDKAARLGTPIVAEYFDGGVSGTYLTQRPGMQAALADLRDGRADTLICPNIDRYSRDEEHQHAIRKAVRAAGGRLVFCDMDFEDTPAGDLNFTIQGGFAAYERKVIGKRLSDGKRESVEGGNQVVRVSPYGYHIVTKADVIRGDHPPEMIGRYVLREDQAEVMRWAFAEYDSGRASLVDLCRDLNRRGVPTARGGAAWRPGNLGAMFDNPVYKGRPEAYRLTSRRDEARLSQINPWTGRPYLSAAVQGQAPPERRVPLTAPAVVSEAAWGRVQDRMRAGRGGRGGNPARVRLLSGRLLCPWCGGRLDAWTSRSRPDDQGVYVCAANRDARRLRGQEFCRRDRHPMPRLEAETLAVVAAAASRPSLVRQAAEALRAAESAPAEGDPRRELAATERLLARLRADEVNAVQAQVVGMRQGASADAYAAVFADIAARRSEATARKAALTARLAGLRKSGAGAPALRDADVQTRALRNAVRALTSPQATTAEKRVLMGTIIDSVTADPAGVRVRFLPGTFGDDVTEAVTLQYDPSMRLGPP